MKINFNRVQYFASYKLLYLDSRGLRTLNLIYVYIFYHIGRKVTISLFIKNMYNRFDSLFYHIIFKKKTVFMHTYLQTCKHKNQLYLGLDKYFTRNLYIYIYICKTLECQINLTDISEIFILQCSIITYTFGFFLFFEETCKMLLNLFCKRTLQK